jgi:hypothetical protein
MKQKNSLRDLQAALQQEDERIFIGVSQQLQQVRTKKHARVLCCFWLKTWLLSLQVEAEKKMMAEEVAKLESELKVAKAKVAKVNEVRLETVAGVSGQARGYL